MAESKVQHLPPVQSRSIAPSEARRYELTLGDYWRIILKRRLIIFLSFVFVLILSIVYTNSKTPLYESSSAVRVITGPRAFQYEGGMLMPQGDILLTYSNMIRSNEVTERVVIKLKLLPPNAKTQDLNDKAAEIGSSITTSQDSDTGTIGISVVYPNPELAAAIANQAAESFIQVQLLDKSKKARTLRRFIETQLQIFSENLQKTENQMREFRQNGRALGIAGGMEQRLADLEKDHNVLLKQFTEKHPDVIKLNAEMEGLRERMKKLPGDELELARLQRELEINDRAYRSMKDKYESAKLAEAEQVSDVSVTSSAAVPTVPISPNKRANKLAGALVGIVVGILLAFIQENMDTSIGAIEDVEQVVRLPVIGVLPYFNPHKDSRPWWRFDRSLIDIFERRKDLPPDSSFLIMNQDTFSTLSEAYRILRTFVEFMMGEKGERGRIIMLTSTGPQEGKTLTSCNLAISLAQAGRKILLIDADLRRPTVHRLFGLKRSPGLSDVLMGTVSLDEAKKTMGDILVGETSQWDHMLTNRMLDRLEILTTGIHTPTPAELIGSDAMKRLLEEGKDKYDYVLVDTPPVLPVTDARTLGLLADATFFIYRAGKTARRALTRAREELNLAGVQVKGIVLNQATPEVTLTDSYYYQYYGEKREDKKKKSTSPIRASRLDSGSKES